MTTGLTPPLIKRKSVINLGPYYDALRASVPGLRQRTPLHPALAFLHRPKPKLAGPVKPRPGPSPAKTLAPPAPRMVTRTAPMTDADDDYDVAPEVARWWNKASIEERCFFMGLAASFDPTKAHQAYQDALARAEEVKAAERTHQVVVAKARAAKAAPAGAASRIITNGTGGDRPHYRREQTALRVEPIHRARPSPSNKHRPCERTGAQCADLRELRA